MPRRGRPFQTGYDRCIRQLRMAGSRRTSRHENAGPGYGRWIGSCSGSVMHFLPRLVTKRRQALALCLLVAAAAHAQQATPDGTATGGQDQSNPPATAASTPSASAATSAPASGTAPSTAAADANVTTLEKYTVSDVPVEEQILPTVRPLDSVFGDAADIIDIPRAVSMVNKAWMDDRQVTNSMDFGQFAPGVYSPARYGVPATPIVRGDNAQIYLNGQAALFTTSSILPSFNGVESMDVVKGPGSAIYGPQSEGAGGYVNFTTKEPYFDHEHTEISMTLGYWTSGNSYGDPEVTIDTGGPITSDLAYRVSYLSRYGNGYYNNQKNDTQDIFVALTYLATKTLKFDWWAQYYENEEGDVTGVNRVTQAFINNGTYIGGQVTAYPDSPPFGMGSVDGSYGVLNPATAYTVKLPWYDNLLSPGDVGRTGRLQSQLIATLNLTPDSSIINRTYFENANDRQFNLWGYSEYVPTMASFQDRAEYHADFTLGRIENKIITGADFRYTRIIAYQDYAVEPFFYFDLYKPSSDLVFPAYAELGNTLGAPYLVPGHSKYGAYLVNDSADQDSHIYDSAAFLQDNITLTKYLFAIAGARFDRIAADDGNPALNQVDSPVTGQFYTPGVYIPRGGIYYASDTVSDPSVFASLVFKLSETSSFYASYNRVSAVLGSENYGGLNVAEITDGANTPIGTPAQYLGQLDTSLKTKSILYEVGYKQSLLNNTLFVDGALYQQTKDEPQVQGPAYLVKAEGLELDLVYQPNKALSINANFTYESVTDFGSAFFQQTYSYLDGYPAGFIVDGQSGTGNGSPNYSSVPNNNYAGYYSPPGSRMKAPGVPQVLGNFFVQYSFQSGFGFGLGPQFQGRQYADDQDALYIPAEYELDGFLFYRRKSWDATVNIKNMTNNRILDPIDVTFAGNDAIYVRPPITASLTIRLRF
jgi:outer membrane receptor for monomeric catechols